MRRTFAFDIITIGLAFLALLGVCIIIRINCDRISDGLESRGGSGEGYFSSYVHADGESRLRQLDLYFAGKSQSGLYMLVSQEAAFYKLLEEAGMEHGDIEKLVRATGAKPKALVQAWQAASGRLEEIDARLTELINEKYLKDGSAPDDAQNFAAAIDSVFLDILIGGGLGS